MKNLVNCLFFNKDKLEYLSKSFDIHKCNSDDIDYELLYFRPLLNNFNKLGITEDLDNSSEDKNIIENNIDNYLLYKNEIQTKLNFMFLKKIFKAEENYFVVQDSFREKEIRIDNHIKNASIVFTTEAKTVEKFIAPNIEESEIAIKSDNYEYNTLKEIELGNNNKLIINKVNPIESIKAKSINLDIERGDSAKILKLISDKDLTFNTLKIDTNIRFDSLTSPFYLKAEELIYFTGNIYGIVNSAKVKLEAKEIHLSDITCNDCIDGVTLICEKLKTGQPSYYIKEISNIKDWEIYMGYHRSNSFACHIASFNPSSDLVSITKRGNNRICDIYIKEATSPNGKSIKFERDSQVHIFYKDKEIKGDVLYV